MTKRWVVHRWRWSWNFWEIQKTWTGRLVTNRNRVIPVAKNPGSLGKPGGSDGGYPMFTFYSHSERGWFRLLRLFSSTIKVSKATLHGRKFCQFSDFLRKNTTSFGCFPVETVNRTKKTTCVPSHWVVFNLEDAEVAAALREAIVEHPIMIYTLED